MILVTMPFFNLSSGTLGSGCKDLEMNVRRLIPSVLLHQLKDQGLSTGLATLPMIHAHFWFVWTGGIDVVRATAVGADMTVETVFHGG